MTSQEEIKELRAKVAGLDGQLGSRNLNKEAEYLIKLADLQAQLDAIYALKPVAYIDVSSQCIRPACLITFHTPTVANIPDIELVVLPPRGEV